MDELGKIKEALKKMFEADKGFNEEFYTQQDWIDAYHELAEMIGFKWDE